jgi:hypothetical protein
MLIEATRVARANSNSDVERHNSNSMPAGRREDRICEIDRRVAELDALLDKFRNNVSSVKDPTVLSADAMIYWSDHHLERNTLLSERYRLTKKSA